jgi:ribonuclease PH
MRSDGRNADELRPLSFEVDFTQQPLGSVLCSMGNTRVLCTVSEEVSVPRWMKGSGKGWMTAEYSMLPAATNTRNDRESTRGKVSGRTMEIQRLIGRSLRSVVILENLGERTLWVDCDVLQAGSRVSTDRRRLAARCCGTKWLRSRSALWMANPSSTCPTSKTQMPMSI